MHDGCVEASLREKREQGMAREPEDMAQDVEAESEWDATWEFLQILNLLVRM